MSAVLLPRRSLRSVVMLMLLLWTVQFGAQLCAMQCGLLALPAAGDRTTVAAPAPADAQSAVADAGCASGAACELGQMPMLPVAVIAGEPGATASADDPPAAPRANFLRVPEDRPPAA